MSSLPARPRSISPREAEHLLRRRQDSYRDRSRSRDRYPPPPPPRQSYGRRYSPSPPPPPRHRDSVYRRRSRSPPRRYDSRSPPPRRRDSPPPRRRDSPPLRRRESPPRRRESRSPPPYRRRDSRSPPPPRSRHRRDSRSPPPRHRAPSPRREYPPASDRQRYRSRSHSPKIRLGNHTIGGKSPSPPGRPAAVQQPPRPLSPQKSPRAPPREPRESQSKQPREPPQPMQSRESQLKQPPTRPKAFIPGPSIPTAPRARSPPRGPRNSETRGAMGPPPAPSVLQLRGYQAVLHGQVPSAPRGPRSITEIPKPLQQRIQEVMPVIPEYKPPLAAMHTVVDAEIQRLQAHRSVTKSEYKPLQRATRRALHELEIATLELRAAEARRIMVQAQAEKAKAGLLGVDYQPA